MTNHWGALLFGYFLLGTQEKVTRYQAKKIYKRNLKLKLIEELLNNLQMRSILLLTFLFLFLLRLCI